MPKKNFDEIVDTNPALAFMSNIKGNAQNKVYDNMIPLNVLVPYENHPFKLYEGERLSHMVRSIKEMGILQPIIVRPVIDSNKYEILSGHNRVNAAKEAGLIEVPAIIKKDLSEDEARLIVTESNLVQRSFADLSHGERAAALKCHMDAISKQGKRTDIINEINSLLNADKTDENSTSGKVCPKLESRDKTAEKYGLSPRNISNYIRLCKLDKLLLEKIDNGEIAFIPAVSISYLSFDEQIELIRILNENKCKVDMKKAEMLRIYSENKKLTVDNIVLILSGELSKKPKTNSTAPFKIKYKIYSKYFDDTIKHDEAESIIDKALEEYFRKYK